MRHMASNTAASPHSTLFCMPTTTDVMSSMYISALPLPLSSSSTDNESALAK